jgi:hypothetical protein
MSFDSFLDLLESRRVRIGAVALLVVVALFYASRHDSIEARMGRVCASLYRLARSAADTAAIDTSRTALRTRLDGVVIPEQRCGDLRRAGAAK